MTTVPAPAPAAVPDLTDKEVAAIKAKMEARAIEQQKDADMLEKWQEHKKLENLRAVGNLIGKFGIPINQLHQIPCINDAIQLALKAAKTKAIKGSTKAPAKTSKGNTSNYVAPPAKWHKEGFKPYGGGRGPKPQWVIDAEADGTIDNYLINKPE